MDVDNYQRAAARTLIDKPDFVLTPEHAEVAASMIRLGAHIGRIMEYVKKSIFHQHGFSMDELGRLFDDIAEVDTTSRVPLDGDAVMMIWNAIGYIGEACEVAGLLEQSILQGEPLDVAELGKELGDGAWYPNALATRAGLRMSDILAANLDKLRTRYPNGYSSADSVARVDVAAPADPDNDPCVCVGAVCWCDRTVSNDKNDPNYHYIIGRDGEITNYADPTMQRAWHAGEQTTAERQRNFNNAIDRTIDHMVPADYSANLAFDGTVLLDTEGSEPPTIFIPSSGGKIIDKSGCAANFRIEPAHDPKILKPIARIECAAHRINPHFVADEYTPCDLNCGGVICSACYAEGYTTCWDCCAESEE